MTENRQFSRPARLAARLIETTDDQAAQMFSNSRVLVRVEDPFDSSPDAREALLFAANQILRFCPNVSIQISQAARDLLPDLQNLKREIHGDDYGPIITVPRDIQLADFDAILNIGSTVVPHLPWVTINSSGWVARAATAQANSNHLFWSAASSNPCGALAAACLGAGLVFLTILGQQPVVLREFSMFTHRDGVPGSLETGPPLPDRDLNLQTFLVGCGAVANGWAYAVRRLPMSGQIQAIDKQSLQFENLGPYVLAGHSFLQRPKVDRIQEYLAPKITVTPRADEWELFKVRFRFGLRVPPLIINGLDNVLTRHSVQRLWPATLIDMAAGGFTSQVLVSRPSAGDGCLLTALQVPEGELDWAERLAEQTGLSVERIRQEPTSAITQLDIDNAKPHLRPGLAKTLGGPICGRITEQNLKMEGYDPDFAPAVPFVTAFSGVVGAAETMKYLMGASQSLHFQQSFLSYRGRAMQMKCEPNCECQSRSAMPANSAM